MFKCLLALPSLGWLLRKSAENIEHFGKLDFGVQLWVVIWLSLLYGLWFGSFFPKIVWGAYRDNEISLLFPWVISGFVIIPYLGTVTGLGLSSVSFLCFWIIARGAEAFISGIGYSKRPHKAPRRV